MPVIRDGSRVRLEVPGDRGVFHGAVQPDGNIGGFWIQPPGVTLNSAYATPATLTLASKDVWVGEIQPLADRITLFMKIERAEGGALTAFMRNPEFNFGLRRPMLIELDGDRVSYINKNREGDVLRGRFDPETRRLSMEFQGVGTFEFSREGVETMPGVLPASGSEAAAPIGVPLPTQDGWETAKPEAVGMDSKILQALADGLRANAPDGLAAPYPHAVLVARRGKLVFEQYLYGHDRDRLHDTRSAGKSLTSILLGITQSRTGAFHPDTPIQTLFAMDNPDPAKSRITVEHLLTMTSGLDCDDNNEASPGNEDVMQSNRKQPDWYRYTLDLPVAREPGGKQSVYCSAGINLLGGIIAQQSRQTLYEFFDSELAKPLGIKRYHMNLMPDGKGYAAGGIYLRPRDALKLGQLYLDRGRWRGKRVVPAQWVADSTKRHAEFDAAHGYGYAWHLRDIQVGTQVFRSYAAEGNGGQFIIVVPEVELVVMIAGGNYGDFKTWFALSNLVGSHVIPAVR
ncbi:MAG: serine hydrolase [Ahniella sp.]|nr:serine hydrolase [Ahniella sp.]